MAVAARYVNRELVSVFLVVVIVLLVVGIGGRFMGYLQDAALGKYSADGLLTIFILRLPGFLQLLLPFALYLSVLLTLGRLHADQEFDVLKSGGTGPARLIAWLALPVIAVAVCVGYFSTVLTPVNNTRLTQFMYEQRMNEEFQTVVPGMFHIFARGKRVTYAESLTQDKQQLNEVFMAELQEDGTNVTVWAERGRQAVDPGTGSRFLSLTNGTRYRGRIGDTDYQVVEFDALSQRLAIERPVIRRFDEEDLSMAELLKRDDPEAIAELHWRLALPIVVVVAGFIALGLSRVKPRQGRFARVVPGFAVFLAYYVLLVLAQDAIANGYVPAPLGMWPVHLLFAGLAVVFIRSSVLPARV